MGTWLKNLLLHPTHGRSRGQAMILLAVSFVGLLTAMGLAVDGGNIYLARIRLSRAVDAAALAGALRLPDCCDSATTTYTYAQSYLTANESTATINSLSTPNPGQLTLEGCSNTSTLFMRIIGLTSTTICATATAGYGAIDICMAVDDTGSMDGTEMTATKNGVRSFVYLMNLASAPTDPTTVKIGIVPFRGEFYGTGSGLITAHTPLTADRENVLAGIEQLSNSGGHGGSGTSIGIGIKYCYQELFRTNWARPTGSVDKIMVLFTDGNNEAADTSSSAVNGEFCQKTFPCGLDTVDNTGLSPTKTAVVPSNTPNPSPTSTNTPNPTVASTATRTPTVAGTSTATRTSTPNPPSATPTFGLTPTPQMCISSCLDREARRWAQVAKDASVTIYTIGYGADQCCGGTCAVDSCLLKEVASGSDKYYFASSSAVIGEAFNAIGQRIGHRLLR